MGHSHSATFARQVHKSSPVIAKFPVRYCSRQRIVCFDHDFIAGAMGDLAKSQTQDTLETLGYIYTSRFQDCTVSLPSKS